MKCEEANQQGMCAHGDLTSLAPHERLPEILVVPRDAVSLSNLKLNTGSKSETSLGALGQLSTAVELKARDGLHLQGICFLVGRIGVILPSFQGHCKDERRYI